MTIVSIKLELFEIKKYIGQRVNFILKKDRIIRTGIIIEVVRNKVNFGDEDFIPISDIELIKFIHKGVKYYD